MFFRLWASFVFFSICTCLPVLKRRTNQTKQRKNLTKRRKNQEPKMWRLKRRTTTGNGDILGNRRQLLLFRISSDNFAYRWIIMDYPGINAHLCSSGLITLKYTILPPFLSPKILISEFNPRRNSICQGLPSSDILLLKVHQTLGRVDQRFRCPDHLLTGGDGGTKNGIGSDGMNAWNGENIWISFEIIY